MQCFPSEIIHHLSEKIILKLPFLCTPRILLSLLQDLQGKTISIDMTQIFIDKMHNLEINKVYETKKFAEKKINIVGEHGPMPIHCDILITENSFPEHLESDVMIVIVHENLNLNCPFISVIDYKVRKDCIIDFVKQKNFCSFNNDKWIEEYIKAKKDEIVLIHTNEKLDFDAMILPFYQSKRNFQYNSLIIIKDYMYGFSVVIDKVDSNIDIETLIRNTVHFEIIEN